MEAERFPIRIAITPPDVFIGEGGRIAAMLRSGRFTDVHLRHPQATRREMLKLIEEVPQAYHRRLHLHGHFDLVWEFNLGGIQLNGRCPEPPAGYVGPLSLSCHTIDEVTAAAHDGGYEYVTLSPVFDSVSKPGYRSAFQESDLEPLRRLPLPVVALGGITPERLQRLSKLAFSGYAMLGAVGWT